MEMGTSELVQLLQTLKQCELVSYRVALFRDGSEWKAHTLIIEGTPDSAVGSQAPLEYEYDYDNICFIAGTVDADDAVNWLRQRAGLVGPPGKSGPIRHFALPPYGGEMVHWQRHPSHVLVDHRGVAQPLTRYDLIGSGWHNIPYYDNFLLADGQPFFPNLRSAVYRLTYQADDDEMPAGADVSPTIVVRLIHDGAWLKSIDLSPIAIRVSVSGAHVEGTQLTVSGAQDLYQQDKLIGHTSVTCPLPNGLPSQLNIVLSRGNTWLDYYIRDERWPISRRKQPNVTIEYGDTLSEVAALIAQGEGPQIEFKSRVSAGGDRFLQTVSAFANGSGGTIFVGVADESGATVGIDVSPAREIDTINRLIHDNLIPNPIFDVQHVKRDGKVVIMVRIEAGSGLIYGVHPDDPRYYVRRGATNFPAKPEELTAIVTMRNAARSSQRFR